MPKFKKYILFRIEAYYPTGGLGDIIGSFDTINEALQETKPGSFIDHEIVDRDTWEIVKELQYGDE